MVVPIQIQKNVLVFYDPELTGNTHASDRGNIDIEIRTLDSFNLEDIDYIKIDAEGYEIEALIGARKLIEKWCTRGFE